MDRTEVIARLRSVEPALRERGVGSLYLFGSYSRNQAHPGSDVDLFVEAGDEGFYSLSNFMGAYDKLRDTFPGVEVGYSTRDGLSKHVRAAAEHEAIRIF